MEEHRRECADLRERLSVAYEKKFKEGQKKAIDMGVEEWNKNLEQQRSSVKKIDNALIQGREEGLLKGNLKYDNLLKTNMHQATSIDNFNFYGRFPAANSTPADVAMS